MRHHNSNKKIAMQGIKLSTKEQHKMTPLLLLNLVERIKKKIIGKMCYKKITLLNGVSAARDFEQSNPVFAGNEEIDTVTKISVSRI